MNVFVLESYPDAMLHHRFSWPEVFRFKESLANTKAEKLLKAKKNRRICAITFSILLVFCGSLLNENHWSSVGDPWPHSCTVFMHKKWTQKLQKWIHFRYRLPIIRYLRCYDFSFYRFVNMKFICKSSFWPFLTIHALFAYSKVYIRVENGFLLDYCVVW